MKKVSTNITLDPELKKEAAYILQEMGLDLSTFVSLSLKAMINENGLPFKVKAGDYKAKYGKTMEEIDAEYKDMREHPENYKSYTIDELLNELHAKSK